MWIVRLALRRPYTVAVMSLLILMMGYLSVKSMLIDIFPVIDIPVVIVVWNYNGLSANEMEKRVTFLSERAYSTTVNGISKIESQSINGLSILKIYFEQGADIGAAIAQIGAVSNTTLRAMPPGMTPPVILQYNASNVPVAQLTLSSKTLPEDKIFDYGLNFIRLKLFTIPGLATPAPFGGKTRQIIVDIDPQALAGKGLSVVDVLNALQSSNLIIPAGTARMGVTEYNVQLNSSPESVKQFESIPIRVVNGQPVLIGDVAKVSDSYAVQTNMVRVNQKRASYLTILKKANASTLVVVEASKKIIPEIQKTAPDGLEMQIDFDQSVFVTNSIKNVLHEAIIASILVSFMILFFLGSWRSVIIVCTSIPLSIFISIIGLKLTGNTLNIMTLGGLSLAVGMLVDDATVEIENIHRNRHMGKPLTVAILDGAHEIATPALVATMSICIVFFPVVLLTGPAQFLFTPMALAVVIAMMASYLLSRTLVPVLARMLMASEPLDENGHTIAGPGAISQMVHHFNVWRDKAFDSFTEAYGSVLRVLLTYRYTSLAIAGVAFGLTLLLLPLVGQDFFPAADSGMMKLHFRAPAGTRIEETEKLVDAAETRIRRIIPKEEFKTINDMIGLPVSYNLAFVQTDNTGGMDADILVALNEHHKPTAEYMKLIRKDLNEHFPGCTIYFQSADIVSQVLNFGLSSPVDIQIQYTDYNKSYEYARKLRDDIKLIPGVEDVAIKQVLDYPSLNVDVDRIRAAELGLTQRDVANDVLVSLSSSGQISPAFYINPQNSVNYPVSVQVPIQQVSSTKELLSIPITPTASQLSSSTSPSPSDLPMAQVQTLGNISKLTTGTQFNQFNHYTVQRVMNISANIEGRDLGSVASAIQQRIDSLGKLPAGMYINLRGQSEVMQSSFTTLGIGLILAIALVYLLMVILFQSWLDPFIIMLALPGAFMGILWMLVLTHTTLNVESLMGAIVAVGIAVSNSILMVSFANDIRAQKGLTAIEGALLAGKTRLRPVLMTAIAMVLGMIPMAIGAGEGGEQNAPLGRSVIGGLMVATVFTLFIVPIFYSLLRRGLPTAMGLDERFDAEAQGAMAS